MSNASPVITLPFVLIVKVCDGGFAGVAAVVAVVAAVVRVVAVVVAVVVTVVVATVVARVVAVVVGTVVAVVGTVVGFVVATVVVGTVINTVVTAVVVGGVGAVNPVGVVVALVAVVAASVDSPSVGGRKVSLSPLNCAVAGGSGRFWCGTGGNTSAKRGTLVLISRVNSVEVGSVGESVALSLVFFAGNADVSTTSMIAKTYV